jgi:hypothetical protein
MSKDADPEYALRLSLSDVQIVLNHLYTGIYSNVLGTITKVYSQVAEQMPPTVQPAPIPPPAVQPVPIPKLQGWY